MYHAPKPYDYNELLRRRRLAEIEKKLTEMKKPTKDKPKEKTKEPKDPIQKIAKKIIDILPDPTDEQKSDRKQNRDKMKERLYLPVQKAKPNTSELSDLEISKARIIKASTVLHDKGLLQAQESLDSNPLTKGWKIDPQLSNSDHLVVFDSEGAVKVAFRGTKWTNLLP